MWTNEQIETIHAGLIATFAHLSEKVQKDKATPAELDAFSRIASVFVLQEDAVSAKRVADYLRARQDQIGSTPLAL